MKADVKALVHSAIRIEANGKVAYIDPYGLIDAPHDADVIFSTHNHYDHLAPEDIAKTAKDGTILVVPEGDKEEAEKTGLKVVTVKAGEAGETAGFSFKAVPSYNVGKQFHPKENGWLGYIFDIDGETIYIAGDTDINEDNMKIKCDVALVPIGGTYTMTAAEAAALINTIKPKTVIPTHYQYEVGTLADAELFKALVDDGIEVLLQLTDRKK